MSRFIYQSNSISKKPIIAQYNQLKLHSGSQDRTETNIRAALFSDLAEESGYMGYIPCSRCIVYLNNSFYGVFTLQPTKSKSYFAAKYGLANQERIKLYEGSESDFYDEELIELVTSDLDIPQNRERLESIIDMDDWLLYYSIEIIGNNVDWSSSNIGIWRYEGDYQEGNAYSDGRYRTFLYDVDFTWLTTEWRINMFGEDVFTSIMEEKYSGRGSYFKYILESKYYRGRFVAMVSDLLNSTFSFDNVEKTMMMESDRIGDAVLYSYGIEGYDTWMSWIDAYHDMSMRSLKRMSHDFDMYFGERSTISVSIDSDSNTNVVVDTIETYDKYNNVYREDSIIKLSMNPILGYGADYWEVNGTRIYMDAIEIELMYHDKPLSITAHSKPLEDPLVIYKINASSNDFVVLKNASSHRISLKGYCLSDKLEKLDRYSLPDVDLEREEEIVIYGKKSNLSIGTYTCNFNLSNGETVYLSKGGKVLNILPVLRMEKNVTYGRQSGYSNNWFFDAKTIREDE